MAYQLTTPAAVPRVCAHSGLGSYIFRTASKAASFEAHESQVFRTRPERPEPSWPAFGEHGNLTAFAILLLGA